ncbi:unnamed protein product [Miscanthus lutarioriparius]|uniref:Plant heme peroxidase family profile domain-containing protein n=1 Tax=Miscanthus lutarioriparius TaxID=422564 RepID=A0A811RBS7_9POAL|nr:unnamed protein product [Miscanthus lutarioriparius]
MAVVAAMLVVAGGGGCDGAVLKAHFYRRSCPAAEAVVRDIVVARVATDPAALPAKLLRLFFHDCFVRFGRDLWDVQLGRRDGVVSRASEALANLPSPSNNFSTLEANFGSKGLDIKDLVILSEGSGI